MTYDLIIRGGTIADGRGNPLFEADIAVIDGKIVEVGSVSGPAKEVIDASGLLVTPGFVDIHSHYDGQAIWDERLLSSGWHGVTTTVMGNCGVGFAPVRAKDRDVLVELMEGVEDIPGAVLRKGLKWDWSSFPDYLDALERRRHDIDVCAYLPHSAMRVFVMGERAVRRERATDEDIAEMRRLTSEAVNAGAMGFSTSLSRNHRTKKGEPIPSMGANADELSGIALGLTDAGRGVLQMILNLGPEDREEEFKVVRQMVTESKRPLSLTVLQRIRDPEGWRDTMDMIDGLSEEGFPVYAQTIPRPLGTLFGLDMERHPFCYHPSYRKIAEEPLEKKVAIMRDPDFKKKLLSESADEKNETVLKRVQNFDFMFPFDNPPNYAPDRSTSIDMLAEAAGRDPFDFVYDYLLQDDGHSMLFAPNSGYGHHNLEGCKELIQHPRSVVAVSDGGAHVAHISDVSFSTFMLSYWGRDRGEDALDISWLVKRITSDTAAVVGLLDRGMIDVGFKADFNIIDMDRLEIERPYMANDLPMGAKRLLQRAKGYVATIVSGVPIYREGVETGQLPGKVVRGVQPEPV
ncbi:MAG: N-acyl-D-amino-acid deacylase family protein [Alphaproteobacteria bacterium]